MLQSKVPLALFCLFISLSPAQVSVKLGGIGKHFFVHDENVFLGTTQGLHRSADTGRTWTTPSGLPGGSSGPLVALGGLLFLATDSGVYRSQDSGRIWANPCTASFAFQAPSGNHELKTNRALALAAIDSLLVAATPHGLFRSRDSGFSWSLLYSHFTDSLLMSRGRNLYTRWCELYKSADGGENWEKIGPQGCLQWIAMPDDTTIAACRNPSTDFVKPFRHWVGCSISKDAGKTWASEDTLAWLVGAHPIHNRGTLYYYRKDTLYRSALEGGWETFLPPRVGYRDYTGLEVMGGHLLAASSDSQVHVFPLERLHPGLPEFDLRVTRRCASRTCEQSAIRPWGRFRLVQGDSFPVFHSGTAWLGRHPTDGFSMCYGTFRRWQATPAVASIADPTAQTQKIVLLDSGTTLDAEYSNSCSTSVGAIPRQAPAAPTRVYLAPGLILNLPWALPPRASLYIRISDWKGKCLITLRREFVADRDFHRAAASLTSLSPVPPGLYSFQIETGGRKYAAMGYLAARP